MDDCEDFIPTRGSTSNKNATKQFQVSTYEAYKPKEKKIKQENKNIIKREVVERIPIKMSKAKHEIMKFGMQGFDSTKKEEAKIQLAIKLGAKPPKNKYKNYKQLLQEKKVEKNRLNVKNNLLQLGKNKIGKSTAKGKSFDKKRKKKDGLLDIYGNVKTK